MTLALLGWLSGYAVLTLADATPVSDPVWSLANFGVLGVLAAMYLVSHRREIERLENQIKVLMEESSARVAAAEARAAAAVADSTAVRDATLREVVPAMTLQTDRGDRMMELTERLLLIIERLLVWLGRADK